MRNKLPAGCEMEEERRLSCTWILQGRSCVRIYCGPPKMSPVLLVCDPKAAVLQLLYFI